MPTFLVSRKMNPALARRVEASVTGRLRRGTATHASARLMRRVRVIFGLGLVALIVSIVLSLRHEHDMLRKTRESLASKWEAETTTLHGTDPDFVRTVETKLVELANRYSGDFIAEELKPKGAFAQVMAKPAVYIRGPLASFASSDTVAKASRESGKDTLLLCLVDPPEERDEKALLEQARVSLFSSVAMQAATSNVLRFYDAEAGMPYLSSAFADRIKDAKDDLQLELLSREFRVAPIALAKRAVRSELLIFVVDEPVEKPGVTELDGEGPHYVRLFVLSLDKMTTLLRLRKHVDPSWIRPNRRPQYARELDGCRLALDVRDSIADAKN